MDGMGIYMLAGEVFVRVGLLRPTAAVAAPAPMKMYWTIREGHLR